MNHTADQIVKCTDNKTIPDQTADSESNLITDWTGPECGPALTGLDHGPDQTRLNCGPS